MDVSISGVKGYEFQYKITVFLALQFLHKTKDLEVLIEPLNGEDISLKFKVESKEHNINVQVKREKGLLDEYKLLKWLCHFDSYKADSCLLSNLVETDSTALFVTKSRCSNDISKFKIRTSDYILNKEVEFKNPFISKLNNVLSENKFFKSTHLGIKRNDFLKTLSKELNNKSTFNNAFNKVKILEEFNEETLDFDIMRRLNFNYGIPHSNTKKVYLLILEAVKTARDKQSNLILELNSILSDYEINSPNLSHNYTDRGIENDLINKIKEENKLLLTGISFCGKSEIAKKIASKFTEEGYQYTITSDIQTAESFYFSRDVNNDKILILEDPFGHIETLSNSFEVSSKLEKLVNNLYQNHKIIITSQKVVLESVLGREDLKSKDWIDLTIISQSEALDFWKRLSLKKTTNDLLYKKINSTIYLNEDKKTLQIGQIEYLSRLDEKTINEKTINELDTIARYNSKDIGREINTNHKKTGYLLSIISLCGNTLNEINYKDFAFILSKDKKKYSIITDKYSYLRTEHKFNFKYDKKYKIDKKTKNRLEYLDERGFIRIDNKKITFVHPNYFEAGRFIFINHSESKQLELLKCLLKVIACYNSNTSYFSSKQLHFIYVSTSFKSVKKKIIKIAFKGIKSIFPSTKDNCLVFLISVFEHLNFQHQSEIINCITNTNNDIYSIHWHKKKTPYNTSSSTSFHRDFNYISKNKAKRFSEKLRLKKNLSSKNAWDFLTFLGSNKTVLDIKVFETLLVYKESFIRDKSTQLYFKNIDKRFNKKLVAKIFNDEHPLIVFKGLKGCFESWHKLNNKQKSFLLPFMNSSLNRKDVAIRASKLMTTFSIDYGFESINWKTIPDKKRKETWQLWHKLFMVFQTNVPSSLDIHAPRFTSTMDDAINFLSKENYMDILNCWYDRLDKKILIGLTPDDHEFSLAMNLIKSTKKDAKIRENLFHKLINYKDTSFLLSSLKWFISYWEDLSTNERNTVVSLINSKRKDLRWIKSVIITSSNIPKQLQKAIFNDSEFLNNSSEYIIENIDQNLLYDSLCVYFGKPQPLWWLALQHRNYDIWGEINKTIILKNHKTGYQKCLDDFLFDGVNGFQGDWKENLTTWTIACSKSKNLEIEISALIYATASCTCNITCAKKIWDILISEYKKRKKENVLIERIRKDIVLLQKSERESILKIIDNDILQEVLNKCFPDILIFKLLDSLTDDIIPDLENSINKLINSVNEKDYIKFYITFKFIEVKMNKLNFSKELKEKLKELPNLIYEKGKELIEPLDKTRVYKLDDWIGKN